VIDHTAAHLALRAQLLTVSTLPAARAFENKDYVPVTGTPYVADSYVPATHRLLSVTAKQGTAQETGLYVVTVHGLENSGLSVRTIAQSILAAFLPGQTFTTTTGDVVRIRSDLAPYAGQVTPLDTGWALCVIRIPWRAFSSNQLAA